MFSDFRYRADHACHSRASGNSHLDRVCPVIVLLVHVAATRTHYRMAAVKTLYVMAGCLLLAGCQSMMTDDHSSVWFRIPPGSELVLRRPLTIPAQRAHIMLQHGTIASAASQFEVACRFEVRDLGPRTIRPDTFLITGYGSQQEWEHYPHTRRFYKTFRLQSRHQAGIMPMVCEYYDWPLSGRPVTLTQIEEALGDYFSFRFPK